MKYLLTFRASLLIDFFFRLGPPSEAFSWAVSNASSTSRTLSFFACPHSAVQQSTNKPNQAGDQDSEVARVYGVIPVVYKQYVSREERTST